MRPLRLELEGFSAFREPVDVDFTDVDLFALTGPTGSGKSSLIDAMIFALYGSVPRYDDERLVAPVITQGKNEARVRFDFSVNNETYTAVRVVRRTQSGATTKEARLQREEEVLAGDAKELTEAVQRLLGLSFGQFTKCVVLPQGDFAEFLHAEPKDRQQLLVKLLGLEMYDRMRSLASGRAKLAAQSAHLAEDQLKELESVDEESLTAASKLVGRLERLLKKVEAELPRLQRLSSQATENKHRAESFMEQVKRLTAIEVPDGLGRLNKARSEAERVLQKAKAERKKAENSLKHRRAARKKLGDPTSLHDIKRTYEQIASEQDKLALATKRLTSAGKKAATREEKVLVSADRLKEVRLALEETRAAHAAHELARMLEPGEPCPVCLQTVETVPGRKAPGAVTTVEQRLERAESRHSDLQSEAQLAMEERASATQEQSSLRKRIGRLEAKLHKAPPPDEIATMLDSIAKAEQAIADAEEVAEGARNGEDEAGVQKESVHEAISEAWKGYDEDRDKLAELQPPAPDRTDLEGSWKKIAAWAKKTSTVHQREIAKAQMAAEKAERAHEEKLGALLDLCKRLDLEIDKESPRDAVFEALTEARARVAQIKEILGQVARLEEQITKSKKEAQIAGLLARHLRADAFERWLLDEAMDKLIDGGSGVLRDLSAGQYSFARDGHGRFTAVDHHNADEVRPIKTLSGGETFLASLSLALTLVDQAGELASDDSAKLESIFLDEGFGSLDSETLDVVASSIEELGSREKMVGVVTHVRDLAERIPVQYRVTKGPATSTVEKVLT